MVEHHLFTLYVLKITVQVLFPAFNYNLVIENSFIITQHQSSNTQAIIVYIVVRFASTDRHMFSLSQTSWPSSLSMASPHGQCGHSFVLALYHCDVTHSQVKGALCSFQCHRVKCTLYHFILCSFIILQYCTAQS